jgi:hypothetical protein
MNNLDFFETWKEEERGIELILTVKNKHGARHGGAYL